MLTFYSMYVSSRSSAKWALQTCEQSWKLLPLTVKPRKLELYGYQSFQPFQACYYCYKINQRYKRFTHIWAALDISSKEILLVSQFWLSYVEWQRIRWSDLKRCIHWLFGKLHSIHSFARCWQRSTFLCTISFVECTVWIPPFWTFSKKRCGSLSTPSYHYS